MLTAPQCSGDNVCALINARMRLLSGASEKAQGDRKTGYQG